MVISQNYSILGSFIVMSKIKIDSKVWIALLCLTSKTDICKTLQKEYTKLKYCQMKNQCWEKTELGF